MNKKTSKKNNVSKTKVVAKNNNTQVVVAKRLRGRPEGSSSQSLVNLKNLVELLPSANITIPISNRFLRSLNNLGLKIEATPFKCSPLGLSEITKTYKVPNSNVTVKDLNTETELVPV